MLQALALPLLPLPLPVAADAEPLRRAPGHVVGTLVTQLIPHPWYHHFTLWQAVGVGVSQPSLQQGGSDLATGQREVEESDSCTPS